MNRLSLLILLILVMTPVASAADNSASQPSDPPPPEWLTPSDYSYNPQGVTDPFVPFVQPLAEEETPERSEPQRPLTPLEKVEVSQLVLVGIIWSTDPAGSPSAMVELPDGKGFIVNKGTTVGKNQGKVTAIQPGQIIVQEEVTNMFGVTEEKQTTLKLRPDQED
ncbi:MAG: pilus assembly protein PilP [Desulfonatronovibrio sp.]